MKALIAALALTLLLAPAGGMRAQSRTSSSDHVVPVTIDNFDRAETDAFFASTVAAVGLGQFRHQRVPLAIDSPVVRPNHDTLYSLAVFDLNAGPVTVTLPATGKRFISMQVIDEEQFTPATFYGPGRYTVDRAHINTRYASVNVRIQVDSRNVADVEQVNGLQDAIRVSQATAGTFETPAWDSVSQSHVRHALLALGEMIPDTRRTVGTRSGYVDAVRHLVGAARSLNVDPEKDVFSVNVAPPLNDGSTIYRLTLTNVPVDGFWSISVYDGEGHFSRNEFSSYTQDNIRARRTPDGSTTIQFGGCNRVIPNCLPTMRGWNYVIRLYQPRAEIVDGTWTLPEAQPVTGQLLSAAAP